MNTRNSTKFLSSLIAVLLLATLALSGCSGSAQIDVNLDDEGSGTIEITGNGGGEGDGGGEADSGGSSSGSEGALTGSQTLLFVVVIAIFLAVLVLVVAASRRPRADYVVHEEVHRDEQ